MAKKPKIDIEKYHQELKESALKKAEELKFLPDDDEANTHNITELIKKFFSEIFKLKYEFTFQELMEDVTKKRIPHEHKINITRFAKKLSQILYKGKLAEKDFVKIIDEFKEIVTTIELHKKSNTKESKTRRESWFNKIITKIHPKNNSEKSNVFEMGSKQFQEICRLIENSYIKINTDTVSIGKKIVPRITDLYPLLPNDEKIKVHKKLLKLYQALKNSDKEQIPNLEQLLDAKLPDPPSPDKPLDDDLEQEDNISKDPKELINETKILLDQGKVTEAKNRIIEVCKKINGLPIAERKELQTEIRILYDKIKGFSILTHPQKSERGAAMPIEKKLKLGQKERDNLFDKMKSELSIEKTDRPPTPKAPEIKEPPKPPKTDKPKSSISLRERLAQQEKDIVEVDDKEEVLEADKDIEEEKMEAEDQKEIKKAIQNQQENVHKKHDFPLIPQKNHNLINNDIGITENIHKLKENIKEIEKQDINIPDEDSVKSQKIEKNIARPKINDLTKDSGEKERPSKTPIIIKKQESLTKPISRLTDHSNLITRIDQFLEGVKQ